MTQTYEDAWQQLDAADAVVVRQREFANELAQQARQRRKAEIAAEIAAQDSEKSVYRHDSSFSPTMAGFMTACMINSSMIGG